VRGWSSNAAATTSHSIWDARREERLRSQPWEKPGPFAGIEARAEGTTGPARIDHHSPRKGTTPNLSGIHLMSILRLPGKRELAASLVAVVGLACTTMATPSLQATKSPTFHGAKVNAGSVACSHSGKGLVLTLSDDFVVPDTPAPHWQVVDSRGNAYLLNLLKIKGDKVNKTITVPGYVHDVAKVQIWCAFAETLLGETDLVCSHVAGNTVDAGMQFGHRSSMFMGAKANKGFVTHALENGKSVLVLSDDFVVPDTPAPMWQLVDSSGNVYLLNRLKIKGDKLNKTLVIPPFVKDVAKVQIWCAFAEVLLGEAAFEKAVM
jgi:hypothetical protein